VTHDGIEELLPAYADGDLSDEDKSRVEEHLALCRDCTGLVALLRTASDSLAGFPEVEPSAALREKLSAIPAREKRFRLSLDLLIRPSLQPVFTVATVFLALFSFYMFGPDRERINKAVSRQLHLGYKKVEQLYAKAGSATDSLGAYTDSVFVSLKRISPFGQSDE